MITSRLLGTLSKFKATAFNSSERERESESKSKSRSKRKQKKKRKRESSPLLLTNGYSYFHTNRNGHKAAPLTKHLSVR